MLRVNLTLALVRFIRALAEAAAYVESAIYAGFKTSQNAATTAIRAQFDQRLQAAKAVQTRAEERVRILEDRLAAAEDDVEAAIGEREVQEAHAEDEYDDLLDRLNQATGL